jgi:hypothetical protein
MEEKTQEVVKRGRRTGSVHSVLDVGEVGRRDLLVVNGVKVNVGEEGVLLDLQRVRLARTESLLWVSLEKLLATNHQNAKT